MMSDKRQLRDIEQVFRNGMPDFRLPSQYIKTATPSFLISDSEREGLGKQFLSFPNSIFSSNGQPNKSVELPNSF